MFLQNLFIWRPSGRLLSKIQSFARPGHLSAILGNEGKEGPKAQDAHGGMTSGADDQCLGQDSIIYYTNPTADGPRPSFGLRLHGVARTLLRGRREHVGGTLRFKWIYLRGAF